MEIHTTLIYIVCGGVILLSFLCMIAVIASMFSKSSLTYREQQGFYIPEYKGKKK